MQAVRKTDGLFILNRLKKMSKNFEKNLKKVLTKRSDCDIITKLSRKRGSETVIEN